MTHLPDLGSQALQYYATAAYPCSYLEGRIARSQVAAPSEAIDMHRYTKLVQHGFRRSGHFIYRPYCDYCQACTSLRLPVSDFQPNRSQRRAWLQHQLLKPSIVKPTFSAEHYALYKLYQNARHAGGGMDIDDVEQYIEFLVATHVQSFMVEFRLALPADHAKNELKMVSIIDRLHDGLSAVYTFYKPELRQNYGTFNVLWQIQQTQSLGLNYLYLGYWIGACSKMSYKTRFKPFELFVDGKWTIV